MDNWRKALIEYLPHFMRRFVEMRAIMETEEVEMVKIEAGINKLLNNAFIEDADEDGIARFEKMLGLYPASTDTLEQRRTQVLLKWNDFIPYTYKTLLDRLTTYCGAGGYEITDNREIYDIFVSVPMDVTGLQQAVYEMLDRITPMTMKIGVEAQAERTCEMPLSYVGTISSSYTIAPIITEGYYLEPEDVSGDVLTGQTENMLYLVPEPVTELLGA